MSDDHAQAALFLAEMYRRAHLYADRLDPKGKRAYGRDPLLAALDGILSRTRHALSVVGVSPDSTDVEIVAAARGFKP